MDVNLQKLNTRPPENVEKENIKEKTGKILANLKELQNVFYANGRHALLIVLQGMDASGKDGLIRNVFTSMNPQGVSVTSFKAPSTLERSHDFLWRIHMETPQKGMIKIFNRSHYEDILITRVHKWIDDDTAIKRMQSINDFERMLVEQNNTTILKFYLHISKSEQMKRLTERLTIPSKKWKYNANDFKEAEYWDEYRMGYEDCFKKCNEVPWTIVPSDQNWYKEYVIANAIEEKLLAMKLTYPNAVK